MLINFQVANYKSIMDSTVINFEASSLTELQEENVIGRQRINLLKSIILNGANASGKSKILDAFAFVRDMVLNSATDRKVTAQINTEPFLLNLDSLAKPSRFELEFHLGEKRYRYGFLADEKEIHQEWLLEVRASTLKEVFIRANDEFHINEKKFQGSDGLAQRTRKNALFLTVAAQWNVGLAEEISGWFDSIYIVNGMEDNQYKSLTTKMVQQDEYKDRINNLIREADLGIKEIQIVEGSDEDLNRYIKLLGEGLSDTFLRNLGRRDNSVFTVHNVYDSNGSPVSDTTFPMKSKESEGTKKFYNLAGLLIDAIEKGRLVVFDEMDARLHSLLTRAIVLLFNCKDNRNGGQLLAVSHDSTLMDNQLLRRDQIYFVEKDQQEATRITSLAEFKVRKDSPYSKNYLEGKYGGIPFIDNLEVN